ncbi:MAG: hypothetical protein ACFFD1_16050, partial [Candidatus Thorarchaeota archaeon]
CDNPIRLIAFSSSGDLIAFEEETNKITILKIDTKEKKQIKIRIRISSIIFHPNIINEPYLFVLGNVFVIIDINKMKIVHSIDKNIKNGIITKKGDRLFGLNHESTTIDVYNLQKMGKQVDLITQIVPKLSTFHSIFISPDDRILIGLSTLGIELWDITIPGQEISLIWSKNISNIKMIEFLPNGWFYGLDNSKNLFLWSEALFLDEIRRIFQKFHENLEKFRQDYRKIPQWILDKKIDSINNSDIPLIESSLVNVKFIIEPPILNRFSPPNYPFWVKEVFIDELFSIKRLEEQVFDSMSLFQETVEAEKKKLMKKAEIHRYLINRCQFYLQSLTNGTKLSMNKLADYLSLTEQETLTLIKDLDENHQLIHGKILKDIFGRIEYIAGGNEYLDSTTLENPTCFFCAAEIRESEKNCPECHKNIPYCSLCSKIISKRQDKLACAHCNVIFHDTCLKDKVRLFKRCPSCKTITSLEELEHRFKEEAEKKIRLRSSLGKMIELEKNIQFNKEETFDF